MPLDFERITLNAIPDGDLPVFHASQFETMRPFIADLKWGSEDFAPGEDNWCTLSIRKNDDTLVIIDDIDIDNNTVSCILTQQSVACMGDNFCQLKVWGTEADEDGCIACLNFILHVQPDPEANGITSESEISNLTQQIEDITQEVIGNDYYNKTEVDGLISGVESQIPTKTSDLTNDSGYITSSDLTPYAKTADLATVATTGDYDDLLNKPTIPDAQIQSDWEQADNTKVDYIKNKPDIDAMIDAALLAVMPVGTESGPIASFDTEIAAPLVNVSCDIVATGGNGTPDSPIPINGYTEANITRCGVNLFDKDGGNIINAYLSTKIEELAVCRTVYVKCNPSTQYTVSKTAGQRFIVAYTKELPALNVPIYGAAQDGTASNITITTGADAKYIVAMVYNGNVDTVTADEMLASVQIAEGTDTTYHAYTGNTYTIAFGQTVYGGVLDVTRGKLTVTHTVLTFNGSENWTTRESGVGTLYELNIAEPIQAIENISNMYLWELNLTNNYTFRILASGSVKVIAIHDDNRTDLATFKSFLSNNNLTICAELATPFGIDLTPEVISAVVGTNNVYSDTNGDTTVQFKDSIQHYIDTRV